MADKYKPVYAKGQIIVCYKNNNYDMGPALGKHLGYEILKEESKNQPAGVFVYKIKEGAESEAQKKFSKYTEFVEWVSLKDLKEEKRGENLEKLLDDVQDLRDEITEYPDKKYNSKLTEIINYIERIKEPEKRKYKIPIIKAKKKK
ncbi:MAG TPA: hypothetical protein VEC16_06530 [Alphaproteobacteria bacterium]|nr:hypothetical protein [Alphaproteobacteria bacterium]